MCADMFLRLQPIFMHTKSCSYARVCICFLIYVRVGSILHMHAEFCICKILPAYAWLQAKTLVWAF